MWNRKRVGEESRSESIEIFKTLAMERMDEYRMDIEGS